MTASPKLSAAASVPRRSAVGAGLLVGASLVGASLVVWLVGQWFRDATWLTGLCFYVPSPVIAATLIVTAVSLRRTRRRSALVIGVLSLAPVLVAVLVENRPLAAIPISNIEPVLRVVHWNVSSRLRSPGAIDVLVAQHPDLIVLSEAGPVAGIEQLMTTLGPDWHREHFAGLAVLSRDPLRLGETSLERRRTMVKSVFWERSGQTIHVLVVDLPSELNVARDPLLREINQIIERHQPDIVVGDFNAPRRSRQLARLPAGYRQAFDVVGHGCGYTWPSLAPVLAIDHLIVGPRIIPVRYDLGTSLVSDHRFQVFDGAWNAP